jgi:hypothetical protein
VKPDNLASEEGNYSYSYAWLGYGSPENLSGFGISAIRFALSFLAKAI